QLVDGTGSPKAGVDGAQLVVPGADGPHFLAPDLSASASSTASTSSGWVVFYGLAPGLVSLGQAANPTVTLTMADQPVDAGAFTIATIQALDGAPPALPMNVSFKNDVFPIFSNRGCVSCHSGNGAGRDL